MTKPKFKICDRVVLAHADIHTGKHGVVVGVTGKAWGIHVFIDTCVGGPSQSMCFSARHLEHEPVIDTLARLIRE